MVTPVTQVAQAEDPLPALNNDYPGYKYISRSPRSASLCHWPVPSCASSHVNCSLNCRHVNCHVDPYVDAPLRLVHPRNSTTVYEKGSNGSVVLDGAPATAPASCVPGAARCVARICERRGAAAYLSAS